jgi:hypothetical protein
MQQNRRLIHMRRAHQQRQRHQYLRELRDVKLAR